MRKSKVVAAFDAFEAWLDTRAWWMFRKYRAKMQTEIAAVREYFPHQGSTLSGLRRALEILDGQ